MNLKIVQTGDPVLRKLARELAPEEIASPSIQQLIDLMRSTMRDAPGVGLAAPQVGVSLRIVVIEDRAEYSAGVSTERLAARERAPVPFHVLINPKIVASDGEEIEFFEGCLSVEGCSALVPRARSVMVECLDETSETKRIAATGWYARILQHEIDHLNGILYLDRMDTRSFSTLANFNRHWKDMAANTRP